MQGHTGDVKGCNPHRPRWALIWSRCQAAGNSKSVVRCASRREQRERWEAPRRWPHGDRRIEPAQRACGEQAVALEGERPAQPGKDRFAQLRGQPMHDGHAGVRLERKATVRRQVQPTPPCNPAALHDQLPGSARTAKVLDHRVRDDVVEAIRGERQATTVGANERECKGVDLDRLVRETGHIAVICQSSFDDRCAPDACLCTEADHQDARVRFDQRGEKCDLSPPRCGGDGPSRSSQYGDQLC
jgi:hypothetical protein